MRLVLCLSLVLVCTPASLSAQETGGVVSAASPEAAEAGAEILAKGGNAVDAAVAVSLALGVTEPAGSGIGGQTSMILFRPGEEPVALNGTSFAPSETPTDAARNQLTSGYTATTVPATLKTLEYAWRNYGSGKIAWTEVLAPAIRYAEEGFKPGLFRRRSLERSRADLAANPATRSLYLDADGSLPDPDELFRQLVLAKTLRRIAEHGADDFYRGEIARGIAADMTANGGWLTLADLAKVPDPLVMKPLAGSYRGWTVHTLPPPAGGWVVLRILNILENVDADRLSGEGSERTLWLLDALQVGHAARAQAPIGLQVGSQREVTGEIDKEKAREDFQRLSRGGETTHFSLGDKDGMLVAVTQSLNSYFGARAASPALGFLYNDYMREFELGDPDHPFALKPGAAPYSSMSASILSKDGVPQMAVGSPGSARIISAVAQVIHYWVDVDRDIAAAVAAYRVHVVPPGRAYIEQPDLAPDLLAGLAAREFTLQRPAFGLAEGHLDPYFGGVHAVAIEDGVLKGAADPRRDGAVIATPADAPTR